MFYKIVKNLDDHPFYFGDQLEEIGFDTDNQLVILKDTNGNKHAASEDELD